jgi:hypothetical protein
MRASPHYVAILAIAIGANAAVFALVDVTLLAPVS